MKPIEYSSIDCERLILKVLTLDYRIDVFKHFSDVNITKFMDIEPCRDIKEAEEIIKYHIEDSGCRWALLTKPTDEFIGTCGFHYLRKMNNVFTAEVGYDLVKTFWGKGLMLEAIQRLIEFGFTKMNLDVIDATVDQGNERSIKLMDRLGFKREAEVKGNDIYFYLKKEDWLLQYK